MAGAQQGGYSGGLMTVAIHGTRGAAKADFNQLFAALVGAPDNWRGSVSRGLGVSRGTREGVSGAGAVAGEQPPVVVIANRDGLVEVRLIKGAE